MTKTNMADHLRECGIEMSEKVMNLLSKDICVSSLIVTKMLWRLAGMRRNGHIHNNT